MLTTRTRALLVGAGLGHTIAALDRAIAGREILTREQERIALQLIETETQLEFERGLDCMVQ